jgi:drug/metabolite transporter (DMT)-like permease
LYNHRYIFLLFATALLWSFGGVLIKAIDWNPIAIAGSRSLISAIVIGLAMPRAVKDISWRAVPGAIAYSATVILFVVATKLTTAANAIFLQYTAPVYIAIISPWVLGEKTTWRDWLFIVTALFGIALFFLDQLSLEGRTGVIASLGSGVAFAWLTILMRYERNGCPETAVFFGNVLTFLLALPWMLPVVKVTQNGPWLLLLGVFQLGIPYLLYAKAIRYVRALDAVIVSIIEPILNPTWVMFATGEYPSFWSIAGGSIVLLTSLMRSISASYEGRAISTS